MRVTVKAEAADDDANLIASVVGALVPEGSTATMMRRRSARFVTR